MTTGTMTAQEYLNLRLKRCAISVLLMFASGLAVLGHLATQLKARVAASERPVMGKRGHAR